MKIGIALCGGGSLGSYEVGAIEKLFEKGLTFDVVTGASIGALNGYFVATHDFPKAIGFWETIEMSDIIKHGFNTNKEAVSKLFENRALQARKLVVSYLQNIGVDIAPYKELLKNIIDLQKIKEEGAAKLGVIYTSYPSMKENRALLNEESDQEIMDHLLASSACFPIFPLHKIGKKLYLDGGWTNNLPVDYCLELGAEYVYAIGLRSFPPAPQKAAYYHLPNVTFIMQSRNLGFMMDFDPKTLARNRMLGYLDAGRVLGDYYGGKYAFEKNEGDLETAHAYFMKILKADGKGAKHLRSIKNLLNVKARNPKEIDIYVAALEYYASAFEIDEYKLYSFKSMLEEIVKKASAMDEKARRKNANRRYLSDLLLVKDQREVSRRGVNPILLRVPSLL